MNVLKYAMGNLLRRKGRFVAVVLVIALVVGFFGGFVSAAYSFQKYIYDRVREQMGGVDIAVTNTSGLMDFSIVEEIRGMEGVGEVDYELQVMGLLKADSKEGTIPLYGVTDGFRWRAEVNVRIGLGELVVTKAVAEDYGISKGSEVEYVAYYLGNYTKLNFTVSDVVEVEELTAFAPPRLEAYANITYLWEKIPALKNKVSAIYIKAESPDVVDGLCERLREKYPDLSVGKLAVKIEMGFESSALFLMIYVLASAVIVIALVFYLNIEERQKEIGILKSLGATNKQIVGITMLEGVLSALLGTAAGYGLSVVIGKVFATVFQNVLKLKGEIPLVVPSSVLIYGAALGFALPTLVVLLMVKVITRIDPAVVLREVAGETVVRLKKGVLIAGGIFLILGIGALFNPYLDSFFWWGRLAGLSMLLPVLVLHIFGNKIASAFESIAGAAGKLGVVFLRRKVSRAILIVALLSMALSFTALTQVSNAAWSGLAADTVEHRMLFDIQLSFSNPMPWNVSDRIKAISGVEDVMLFGFYATETTDRQTVFIYVINVSKFSEFLGWRIKNGTVNVGENETFLFELGIRYLYSWLVPGAERTGGYMRREWVNRVLGRNFTVVTEAGNVTLKVRGIVESTMSDLWVYPGPVSLGLGVYVDTSFLKYLPYTREFLVFGGLVKVKEGADPAEVAGEIREELGNNTVRATTKEEWMETSTEISQQMSTFYYVIGVILYIIAIVLIFVTQYKMIMQWGREIATVISMGETRWGVIKMFMVQMLLLGLISSLVVAIDYYLVVPSFIQGMAENTWAYLPVTYDWGGFAVLCGLTTVIAMLASIPAANKAAKQNVAAVLRML